MYNYVIALSPILSPYMKKGGEKEKEKGQCKNQRIVLDSYA